MEEFTIKLDRYEGPYTKLLDLILDHKLSITEVSLASIADEYIEYVKSLQGEKVIDVSQFVLVASTLMLIKVKSLLPGITYSNEEEKQVHDLEKKLELYTLLMKACTSLQGQYLRAPLYGRSRLKQRGVIVFLPNEHLTLVTLQSVAFLTIASFKPNEALKKIVVEQSVRIETIIENILMKVKGVTAVSLNSLAGDAASFIEKKKMLIVNFVALLELIRSGNVDASQHAAGGEIMVSSV
jgi:segregation and condensation protein A